MPTFYMLDNHSFDSKKLQQLSSDVSSLLEEFLSTDGGFSKVDKNPTNNYLTDKELNKFINSTDNNEKAKATARSILASNWGLSWQSWDNALLGTQVTREDLKQLSSKTQDAVREITNWNDLYDVMAKHLDKVRQIGTRYGEPDKFTFDQLRTYIDMFPVIDAESKTDKTKLEQVYAQRNHLAARDGSYGFHWVVQQLLWPSGLRPTPIPISLRTVENEAKEAFAKHRLTLSLANRFVQGVHSVWSPQE